MTRTQFFKVVEIRTKIISMGTFSAGTLYAVYTTHTLRFWQFILMGLATLCVDMGTTGFNSYFDYLNGSDNASLNQEEDKVLVHEHVNPTGALIASLVLFLFAGMLGLVLAYMTSWKLIFVGAVCMVVGFCYTGGPYPISRTPFGELFAGSFLGSVLFLISYYVQSGNLTLHAVLASLPFLLLVALILSINNSCDRISDTKSGRRTLSIVLSEQGNTLLLKAEFALSFLLSVVLVATRIYPLLFTPFLLLGFLFGYVQCKEMFKRDFSEKTKQKNMIQVSGIYLVFCLVFLLGFGFDMLVS